MNPILNQTQPQLQPGQVSQIFQILQASANPTAAIQALIATNPACSQVLPIIQKNSGDYRKTFFDLAAQRGVNAQDFLNQVNHIWQK